MQVLLTDYEMSHYLHVSCTTLWRLRRAGMPYIRVGNSIRYHLDATVQWIESKEREYEKGGKTLCQSK